MSKSALSAAGNRPGRGGRRKRLPLQQGAGGEDEDEEEEEDDDDDEEDDDEDEDESPSGGVDGEAFSPGREEEGQLVPWEEGTWPPPVRMSLFMSYPRVEAVALDFASRFIPSASLSSLKTSLTPRYQ